MKEWDQPIGLSALPGARGPVSPEVGEPMLKPSHLDALDYSFLGLVGVSFIAFALAIGWLLIG